MPVAKAQMMIRKPVAEVYQSLIDPAITSHFWFSKGAAPLEVGKKVRWDWEMYGVHTIADVQVIEPNKRILIEWNGPENPSVVEWKFEMKDKDRTFVTVRNWGFSGGIEEAINSTEGFTNLLAAMKFYLEHGIEPNLVLDHAPGAHVN
jgi:uncharacterized protein YndB with AHSA1/START domain